MKTLNPQITWSTESVLDVDPVAHGAAAEAMIMAIADGEQVALLWGSVPHWSAVVDIPTSSGTAAEIPLIVPPFVDRAEVTVVASGDGNVHVEGLTIAVDHASVDDAGDTDNSIATAAPYSASTLLTVAASNVSASLDAVTVYCDSGVEVYAIGFTWRRSDLDLTDAI